VAQPQQRLLVDRGDRVVGRRDLGHEIGRALQIAATWLVRQPLRANERGVRRAHRVRAALEQEARFGREHDAETAGAHVVLQQLADHRCDGAVPPTGVRRAQHLAAHEVEAAARLVHRLELLRGDQLLSEHAAHGGNGILMMVATAP
jgi:hypothetical protein